MWSEYNGGAAIAMAGQGCVAMACDLRLGTNGFENVSTDHSKISFLKNNKTLFGAGGLATDITTLRIKLEYLSNLYGTREGRAMTPYTISKLLSTMMYSRRFSPYLAIPILCGLQLRGSGLMTVDKGDSMIDMRRILVPNSKLGHGDAQSKLEWDSLISELKSADISVESNDSEWEVYLSCFDHLGSEDRVADIAVTGSSYEQLLGCAESFWMPNMDEDDLFETISQTMMAAMDRDCVAGWGAEIHLLTPTEHITRRLRTRMD